MRSPGDGSLPPAQDPGMVGHVRVIAVLMMVQGVLVALVGLGLVGMVGMGLFMPAAMKADANFQEGQEFIFDMLFWVYGGMGIVIAALGLLNVYAGFRNWSFKNRTLGIVALAAGFVTVFTCYCGPTAIGIGVYGLIVYLNPSSTAAFRMGDEGYSRKEIKETFSWSRFEQSQFMP